MTCIYHELPGLENSMGAKPAPAEAPATAWRVGESITDAPQKERFFASPWVASVLRGSE